MLEHSTKSPAVFWWGYNKYFKEKKKLPSVSDQNPLYKWVTYWLYMYNIVDAINQAPLKQLLIGSTDYAKEPEALKSTHKWGKLWGNTFSAGSLWMDVFTS